MKVKLYRQSHGYKKTVVGGFTGRQALSLVVALVLLFGIGILLKPFLDLFGFFIGFIPAAVAVLYGFGSVSGLNMSEVVKRMWEDTKYNAGYSPRIIEGVAHSEKKYKEHKIFDGQIK